MHGTNFNLEKSVAMWREQMRNAGMTNSAALAELETHLREDFAARVVAGDSPEKSFQLAVAQIGDAAQLQNEFKKVQTSHGWPVRVGAAVWANGAIGVAVAMRGSNRSMLLKFHIFTVTTACFTGFLLGAWGVCWAILAKSNALSVSREFSLTRAVSQFSVIGLALMTAGMGSGFFISQSYFGVYWRWEARETGMLFLLVWFVVMAAAGGILRLQDRFRMMLAMAGNLIVGVAWFGVGFGMRAAPALAIFAAIHIPLFYMLAASSKTAAKA